MSHDGWNAPLWRRRNLLDDGMDDRAIARQLQRGELHRVRHGAYTSGDAWRSLDENSRHLLAVRAVVAQSRTDVVVSHASAALLLGAPAWGLPLQSVDVTRRDGKAGRREAGVRQHRGALRPGDVVPIHGLPVMSPTRAALEVTTIAPAEASLVVVNHLLRRQLTTTHDLRERYELGIDRWAFTLTSDLVLRRATPLCESVGESRFWHFCHVARLPLPGLQYVVRDHHGHVVARVDFAWPDLGVYVEFDGLTKYRTPYSADEAAVDVVLREKAREDQVRELTGWTCVRVTWAELDDPHRLVARLRRAFAARGRMGIA